MPKVADLNALYPTNCEVLLQVRSEYAGWYYYLQHGYIRYHNAKTNKKIYEHQLVGAKAFGPIPKGYHVHHKEDPKTNNTPDNLEILTNSEHQRRHRGPREFVTLVCPVCLKSFQRDKTQIRSESVYCGQTCSHAAQRPVEPPTKEQLTDLISTVNSWRELGRMFGVCDNTVKGWAQAYGIEQTCSGNKAHTYKAMYHKTSKYKGVSKRKDRSRWYAKILVNEQLISLGTFDTEEAAAKAYDKAASAHFGSNAYLNFSQ